jgi:hypothetical protein
VVKPLFGIPTIFLNTEWIGKKALDFDEIEERSRPSRRMSRRLDFLPAETKCLQHKGAVSVFSALF